MNEADWSSSDDPQPLLDYLRGQCSQRKLRLFLVACCRHVWPLLPDHRSRRAVELGERYADSPVKPAELDRVRQQAEAVVLPIQLLLRAEAPTWPRLAAETAAAVAARALVPPRGLWEAARDAVRHLRLAQLQRVLTPPVATDLATRRPGLGAMPKEHHGLIEAARLAAHDSDRTFAEVLRDIFGNPFRRVPVDPAWLSRDGGLVRQLVRVMYDERRFADLPILADALQDFGCTQEDLLAHCRAPGPHVRGCWALDLLLGKS